MPPKPLFASPKQRAAVVALAMSALLLAALGVAAWQTWRQHRRAEVPLAAARVGALELQAPRDWPYVEKREPVGPFEMAAAWSERGGPGRRLSVTALRPTGPRSPDEVVGDALDSRVPIESVHELRTGLLRASLYTAAAGGRRHHLAAVTEDLRRYWLVHLQAPEPKGPNARVFQQDLALLVRVLSGLVNHETRDARDDDLAAAHLPGLLVPDWRARMPRDARLGDPVFLVSAPGSDSPGVLRLLGVAVATDEADDALKAYSPRFQLRMHALRLRHRPPRGGELQPLTIAGREVWRLWAGERENDPLGIWQWWVPMSPGHMVLLEAAGPRHQTRDLHAATGRVVESLLQSAAALSASTRPATQPSAPPALPAVAPAAALARQVAQAQRRAWLQQAPTAWSYRLLERHGQTIGCQARWLARRQQPAPHLVGRHRTWMGGQHTIALDEQWSGTLDGAQYRLNLLGPPAAADLVPPGAALEPPSSDVPTQRLELDGLRLRDLDLRARSPVELWSGPWGQAFLPEPALQTWSGDLLYNLGDQPALMWLSPDFTDTGPIWVQWVGSPDEPVPPLPAASGPSAGAASARQARLRLRPMMSLDATDIVLRETPQGWERVEERVFAPNHNGRLVLRTATRDQVVARFPGMAGILKRFEEDVARDE